MRKRRPLACPRCGGRLRTRPARGRLPQWMLSGRISAFRCADTRCDWRGWLSRRGQTPAATLRAALLALATPAQATAAAAAGLALAGASWLALRDGPPPAVRVGPRAHAPGAAFDGEPLPLLHPLLRPVGHVAPVVPALAAAGASVAAPLALRRYCAWGKPGRMPYRGTVEQALRSAGLPADVVARIAADVASGRPAERLLIANDGIRSSDGTRSFDARSFAMTYGHTLCLGTRVNFAAGHVEPARLYEAVDDAGQRHSVMVPEVCGNVSVIRALRLDGSVPRQPGQTALLTQWDPEVLQGASPPDRAASVAQPGSLALAVAGLLALAATRRRH